MLITGKIILIITQYNISLYEKKKKKTEKHYDLLTTLLIKTETKLYASFIASKILDCFDDWYYSLMKNTDSYKHSYVTMCLSLSFLRPTYSWFIMLQLHQKYRRAIGARLYHIPVLYVYIISHTLLLFPVRASCFDSMIHIFSR